MSRIYDNIDEKFNAGLLNIVGSQGIKRVDFCVGYFNMRGWNLVVDQIDQLPGAFVQEEDKKPFRTCRLLIGMHRPEEENVRMLYSKNRPLPDAEMVQRCKLKIAEDFRKQLLIGVPTKQDENTLRHLCRQMKEGKVCVKLYLREPLHAKLYIAHSPDDYRAPITCVMGSSNLTYNGLTKQGELNAEFGNIDETRKLYSWFEDRWNDRFCLDITSELIQIIDESWAADKTIPPYYVYLKTAYHLSQDARAGIGEYTLTPEFQHDLLDFQQIAVKIAAKHLSNEKHGGAMIGDVVGLGKTITACAIAKIYENTNSGSTLVICPANLQSMWQKYAKKYDLKVDIVSKDKPIDVDTARSYRLIIVDESHNLRNEAGKRYYNIKDLINRQNCQVLLLTATPYNKDYRDLSAQLKLFISEDQDLGIRPENYIRQLGGERQFLQEHSEVFIRSISAFEKSDCLEDWNDLMRLFLVRRTRTFIKDHYAKLDTENNRKYLLFPDGRRSYFPDRIPHSIRFHTQPNDQYNRLYSTEMIQLMESLKLPRYGLSKYVKEELPAIIPKDQLLLIENLSRAGKRMMGFCKSTFFKRIDSCGYSFILTLYRHLLRNQVFIFALEKGYPLPIGDENVLTDDFVEDRDEQQTMLENAKDKPELDENGLFVVPNDLEKYKKKASEYYNLIQNKGNVGWLKSEYFKRTLKQDLKADCDKILEMINLCGVWQPNEDPKLNELERLLTRLHREDKVLVFTQYADTALYLHKMLTLRGLENIDYVTGDSENPTAKAERFSPVSNEKNIPLSEQTRLLIATDVLSEGQNLQDAHVIVNFDLPWAIIRLIQRAGRVDRIGQQSTQIDCYSFFPAEGVEKIIQLRGRLNTRINQNAGVVGSDEIFFDGNEQNLRDMYNEKSGVLDDSDDNDVDLGSYAFQIWKNATDANPKLKRIIPSLPNQLYSTKPIHRNAGVITYARTYNDYDVLTWLDADGKVVSMSQKQILRAMECDAKTPALPPLDNHHELVSKAVSDIKVENTSVGGILGSRFGTRYKIVTLLSGYCERPIDLFFTEERRDMIKLAIDDIYNFPLYESAKFQLGRMLKRYSQDDIVDYVLELRRTDNLCRIDKDTSQYHDPSIICSMGLNNTDKL